MLTDMVVQGIHRHLELACRFTLCVAIVAENIIVYSGFVLEHEIRLLRSSRNPDLGIEGGRCSTSANPIHFPLAWWKVETNRLSF